MLNIKLRTWRPLNCFLLCIVLFMFGLGVLYIYNRVEGSYTKVENERVSLINGIKSYQTLEDFEAHIPKFVKFRVIRDDGLQSKGHPTFKFDVVKVEDYRHLDCDGELDVAFYNNRLAKTTFFPKNSSKYVRAIREAEPRQSRYLNFIIARDHNNRQYIEWADSRLEAELDRWIIRYS